MLRPKGRTGGLGMGSYGVSKKKDDGLPKNALYSRFVRAGQGDYNHKKFEDSGDEIDDGDNSKAKKKAKKEAKKTKTEEVPETSATTSKKKKRKVKPVMIEEDMEPAAEIGKKKKRHSEVAKDESNSFSLVPIIKEVLKNATGKQMLLEDLQKAVVKQAKADTAITLKKSKLKNLFTSELEGIPKVTKGPDDLVRYGKKAR
mmetsp:Transcript_28308/g.63225  ORF Transcript_28308/g.63225 Transcript_28308/m.63225 type:complete len:201 (-) Transcript_28308:230-832(-)